MTYFVNMEKYNMVGRGRGRGRGAILAHFLKIKNIGPEKKISPEIKVVPEQYEDTLDVWKKRHRNTEECMCEKEVPKLRCDKCKKIFNGRPRIPCKRHTNVIHLMDLMHCPDCKAEI